MERSSTPPAVAASHARLPTSAARTSAPAIDAANTAASTRQNNDHSSSDGASGTMASMHAASVASAAITGPRLQASDPSPTGAAGPDAVARAASATSEPSSAIHAAPRMPSDASQSAHAAWALCTSSGERSGRAER